MKSFENFLKEMNPEPLVPDDIREEYIMSWYDDLMEKLITVGGKAYPKFGNVVILAGGAGSGKGFIKDNLLGIEGKVFDVDTLKTLAGKAPIIRRRVKKEMGVDLEDLAANLKVPENVSKLHGIIGDTLQLDKRHLMAFYRSVFTAAPDRKPNIIFDNTLKDLQKLQNLTRQVSQLGYEKKNIHIVWVVNDIEVAKAQNVKRTRTVPVEILVNTHRGASQTMNDIVNMGKGLKKYMDGDIVFAFNKFNVDTELAKNPDGAGKKIGMKGDTKGGQYLVDADYVYVKRKGKPPMGTKELGIDLKRKVQSYVPKSVDWIND